MARAKKESPDDVTVVILDRPRHAAMVEEVRATGARIKFITDGDVAGAIMAARDGTGIDLMLGIGGTPEGIIAACAIKTLGGVIQGRLWPKDDDERQKALDAGHDLDRVLVTDELVQGEDVFFVATGITDGELLTGVRYRGSQRAHPLDRHAVAQRHDPPRRERAQPRQAPRVRLRRLRARDLSRAVSRPSGAAARLPRPVDLLRAQAGAGSLVGAASSPAVATALCAVVLVARVATVDRVLEALGVLVEVGAGTGREIGAVRPRAAC